MFNKIKNYKLILINKGGASARELNSNKLIFGVVFISALLFVSSLLLFTSKNLNQLLSLNTIQKHKKNNIELELVINKQKERVDNLILELEKLNARDDKMRSLLKLPAINNDIRKLGVGGSRNKNDKFNNLNYLLPNYINLYDLNDDIEFLLRSVKLENLSYNDIEKQISIDKEKVLHYPAILPTSYNDSKFTSGFGYRYDPFTNNIKLHEGHDFSAEIGTEVVSTADGVVKLSKYFGSFGQYIEIDHGNGYITSYGHLSKRNVKKGQSVQRGQIIGKIGNTGRSTAPHLHYEIRYKNNNLDPSEFYFDSPS